MTRIQNVTPEQIQQLRTKAAQAGELARVALCDKALADIPRRDRGIQTAALSECVAAINQGEAPDDAAREWQAWREAERSRLLG